MRVEYAERASSTFISSTMLWNLVRMISVLNDAARVIVHRRVMMMFACSSTSAPQPGGTTVVESSW